MPLMWTAPVAVAVVQLLSCMYCDPIDCSPPLSTGISQVRILDSLLWYKQWSVAGFSGGFRI